MHKKVKARNRPGMFQLFLDRAFRNSLKMGLNWSSLVQQMMIEAVSVATVVLDMRKQLIQKPEPGEQH